MSKTNVFSRAKILWKQPQYKSKTWQQMVSIAAGKTKSVSSTKTNTAMARPKAKTKRKPAAKKATRRRSVSGVTTTTKKRSTTRRHVGALVDRHMFYLAAGMAVQSTVEQMILAPLKSRVPANLKMFIDPAQALLAYKGSTHFKQPIIQGVCLGLMKSGVDGTVKTLLTHMPQLKMQSAPAVSGDYYMPLPGVGEIRQYLSGVGQIPENIGNINNSSMPNMGGYMGDIDPADEVILPLGWNK